MRKAWSKVWRSPTRATFTGVLLSLLIASTLYCFNWHTFYDTRKNMEEDKALLISRDISTLAVVANATPGNDDRFQQALEQYFEPRPQFIEVRRISGANVEWTVASKSLVDSSRTIVKESFTLKIAGGPDNEKPLIVNFETGVRPPFFVALARAWSFSVFDYMEDPENWWSDALYNRSIPLYGYLLTIIFVGFGTIRSIYKDQQDLTRLEQETLEITSELDSFRERYSQEIAEVRHQIKQTEVQRDGAIQHRNELTAEIAAIERECQALVTAPHSEPPDNQRIQLAENRKIQVSLALSIFNEKIANFENQLEGTNSELEAAEQLLLEVEERRRGLSTKLKDRNREIRKLKKLVQKNRQDKFGSRENGTRLGGAKQEISQGWEANQNSIEKQIADWIKPPDRTHCNFSKHGKSEIVEQQFAKIDPTFIQRYFTHANNLEYERGGRCLIRVVSEAPQSPDPTAGKLIIAIDDDIGRTLGLRFETRKEAPEPKLVGFALALLLRAKCKDFRDFTIRTR